MPPPVSGNVSMLNLIHEKSATTSKHTYDAWAHFTLHFELRMVPARIKA
jgi:hypothetical protein